ncbi:hypothetical protein V8G61_14560 [Gaetbulibacter sp. M240]|uniref:hypothetical protein n=1 Tax=Gaetbulibacter sp. M240 TaxID=3126511 RepID=UPI00374F54A5
MKTIKRYPNNYLSYPIMHQPHFWYTSDMNTKEITLLNNELYNSGVSQLDLSLSSISAIDSKGMEHKILKSSGETVISIKGLGSGQFIRTRCLSKLPKGTYSVIRIYVTNDSQKLIFNNKEEKLLKNKKYFDFEIKNKLLVKSDQNHEFKLWFDLVPFQFGVHLIKPFLELFRKTDRFVHRLAGAYGK